MTTQTLEELFGGGPELPSTHWMDRYAKASEEASKLREVLAGDAAAFARIAVEIDHALTWFEMDGKTRDLLTVLANGVSKRCEPVRGGLTQPH